MTSSGRSAAKSTRLRGNQTPGVRLFAILPVLALAFVAAAAARAQQAPAAAPAAPGTINGTVADKSGAALVGATVKLTRADQPLAPDVTTGDDGQFSFAKIAPGPYAVSVSANGFTTQTYSGTLNAGETAAVPAITLAIAGTITKVTVEPPKVELAEIQINEEEHQRVLGVIPNFYVSYIPDAAPLNARQKFELAWKTSIDPVKFGIIAGVAGLEQDVGTPKGWGNDAAGYGQRFGSLYADDEISEFLGDFLFPSLFHQDPRYFYKGTGTTRQRLLYALANAVICKGDNKKWQFNYSYIIGDLAASGISNAYYPPQSRGAGLTFENAGIGIGATAVADVFQEFVVRKLTPSVQKRKSGQD